jgi:hypothetical protein
VFHRVLSRHGLYGHLFRKPLFLGVQVFAMGFNLGVLGSTLLRILFTDTAFGWASTIQGGSHAVFRLVSLMALPWLGFVPAEVAFPSLEEIQGSRIILKDGIGLLTTPDLVSWWPFLCLSLLVYGLLPRVALFVWARLLLARDLARFPFDHGDADRLLRRLVLPRVSTAGRPVPRDPGPAPEAAPPRSRSGRPSGESAVNPCPDLAEKARGSHTRTGPRGSGTRHPDQDSRGAAGEARQALGPGPEPALGHHRDAYLVLVPGEIHGEIPWTDLENLCLGLLGRPAALSLTLEGDLDEDLCTVGRALSEAGNGAGRPWAGIVVLQEAWRPPISQTLEFVRSLRGLAGERVAILLLLVGKPRPGSYLTPPSAMDLSIWKAWAARLDDAFLQLVPLEAP